MRPSRRPIPHACLVVGIAAAVSAGARGMQPMPPDASSDVRVSTSLDLDPSRIVADQIAVATRQLSEPAIEQEARDVAARRLLSIGTAEARSAVRHALIDRSNNPGRLAAARAVADDRPPDPGFVEPLFSLLTADSPRPLLDAAAVALGNFKTDPEVSPRLIALTEKGVADLVRFAAIRGLATQIDKAAGRRLVELTREGPPSVAAAAVEALQTFASLPLSTSADWADWWRTQADQPDDRFRLDMLSARATRFEQAARHGEETFQELRRKVLAEVSAASREARGDVLVRYLTSPRESVRLIAARQAYDYAQTADLPASARPTLRSLLADPSEEVRFESARTMQVLNDAEAFTPIALQLAVETDTRVRAELARAMGPIGNLDAVPLLRRLLGDSSAAVVQAAAGALARLGPSIYDADPAVATDLAQQLLALLQSRAATPEVNPKLREALVEALVPLKQRSLRRTFSGMLAGEPQPESESVRRLAAIGLGAIGDPETGAALAEALRDPAPAVRLEAIRALGKLSDSFFFGETLFGLLDPKKEADAGVRTAAWEALGTLFKFAPRDQLASWPDREVFRGDDLRRLAIFTALAGKAAAAAGEPGARDDHTFYLQQVGDTQMTLARTLQEPARFAAATAAYQQALAITQQGGGPAMRIGAYTELTLRSLLQGRDYAGATQFAATVSAENRDIVGREFRLEADRLQGEGRLDDAAQLIREALAMTPALPAQYRAQLIDAQRAIQLRQGEKNDLGYPEWLGIIYAMR